MEVSWWAPETSTAPEKGWVWTGQRKRRTRRLSTWKRWQNRGTVNAVFKITFLRGWEPQTEQGSEALPVGLTPCLFWSFLWITSVYLTIERSPSAQWEAKTLFRAVSCSIELKTDGDKIQQIQNTIILTSITAFWFIVRRSLYKRSNPCIYSINTEAVALRKHCFCCLRGTRNTWTVSVHTNEEVKLHNRSTITLYDLCL